LTAPFSSRNGFEAGAGNSRSSNELVTFAGGLELLSGFIGLGRNPDPDTALAPGRAASRHRKR
jgi:hypothetical protein